MKLLSDNFLTMLLPLTVVAATAFGLVAAVAFRMGATTAAFVFTALSIVGWIGLVVEFFLFIRHHHRQVAFQRPLCFNRLMVCGFVIVRLYPHARQASGLEHVHRHGFTFCRAFPAALHHRDGLRKAD